MLYELISRRLFSGLNKRLNQMIMDSFYNDSRLTWFIKKCSYENKLLTPVKEKTISEWIRNLVPNRSLNIGTFRSSYVGFLYMVIRMRRDVIEPVVARPHFFLQEEPPSGPQPKW